MPSGCGETRVILEIGGAVPRFRDMPTATATYDHATAVADILAGYYRTEMALRRDDTGILERRHLQDGRELTLGVRASSSTVGMPSTT
jgi:hypothetical protein